MDLVVRIVLLAAIAVVAALLVRRRRGRPAPEIAEAPPQAPAGADSEESDEDLLEELREHVRLQAATGFLDRDEIIESTTEIAEEESDDPDLAARIPAIVDQALEAQAKAQEAWPEVTDCDRLDAAFRLMEARGIVARQNFTCCQTCGHAEMADEIEDAARTRLPVGYTFYHAQDTEAAAEGGGLYLAYGHVEEAEGDAVAVGRAIEACLREAGLEPSWSGETNQRIYVPLDWKRRLPDEAA